MKKVVLFGECMLELRQVEQRLMQQSFAGDAFNAAVYLRRAFPDFEVSFMTAIGRDSVSKDMVSAFRAEKIKTDLIFADKHKVPGIYMVQTDSQGERSFMYWRENSAARQIMNFVSESVVADLSKFDIFFFSGISLAVIEPVYRPSFWLMLKQLRHAGVKIVFDSNYRERLWEDKAEARSEFEKAFSLSDMMLPGVDDFDELYGIETPQEVEEFCRPFDIEELVIKNGPESIFLGNQGKLSELKVEAVKQVVDTTSAGDSFNGVYLGARLAGNAMVPSAHLASKAAGLVIRHPGAIMPADTFATYLHKKKSVLQIAD